MTPGQDASQEDELRNALIDLGWTTEDAIDFAEDMTPWMQERVDRARREERELVIRTAINFRHLPPDHFYHDVHAALRAR